MAACWLLRTPLGALYFNLSWPLVRRHPPRLRDFALPISTRLIRIVVPNSAPDTAASQASHPDGSSAPPMQYSTKAITQLAKITPASGTCMNRRYPYQANLKNRFEPTSSKMAAG